MSSVEIPTLSMWVVYDHPADAPDTFVARRWDVTAGDPTATSYLFTADTLEDLRAKLPLGLTRLDRSPLDDPVIVETWL